MLTLDFLSNDYKEKKTMAQIAEENIEIDIITGRIPSGKRINEQSLCKAYNMSRTPIREILRRIEGNGLVKSIPNRGVFAVGLTQEALDDLFYLKTILEVQCVRWAVERIDEHQMNLLEETFDFMQFYTMSNDLDKILRINEGFDTIIYNSAHNKELETRLNRYNFLIKHANAEVKYPLNYLPTVLEEHRAIFEAFKSKNPDAGAEATEIHMYKSMLRRK
ncbi:MAG: GntR family transcriptional regulator [Firmicutes bacterium]|jgi:DNA-binding GntR family transcriptional regulator|nr:GntR family transcriptional regulator [Bacillota bacterium]